MKQVAPFSEYGFKAWHRAKVMNTIFSEWGHCCSEQCRMVDVKDVNNVEHKDNDEIDIIAELR